MTQENSKEKTLFEKIIDSEIPSDKLYEDEYTYAFLDISPNVKGHCLVIPKKPFKNIYEIEQQEGAYLLQAIRKVSSIMKEILNADGINILMNNDAPAGQEVFHAHFHILPRFEGDKGYHGVKYEYKEGEKEEVIKSFSEYLQKHED